MKTLVFGHYYSLKNVPQGTRKEARAMDCQAAPAGTEEGVRRVVFSPLCCESGAVHGGEAASLTGQGDTHRSNTRNMKLEDS